MHFIYKFRAIIIKLFIIYISEFKKVILNIILFFVSFMRGERKSQMLPVVTVVSVSQGHRDMLCLADTGLRETEPEILHAGLALLWKYITAALIYPRT